MARVVILGAGLGGVIAAYNIRKTIPRQDDVIVINENDFYQFVPSSDGESAKTFWSISRSP